MESNTSTQHANQNTQDQYDNPHGTGTRWAERINEPLPQLFREIDTTAFGFPADVDPVNLSPIEAIDTLVTSYSSKQNPDALVLIGAFARQAYLTGVGSHSKR